MGRVRKVDQKISQEISGNGGVLGKVTYLQTSAVGTDGEADQISRVIRNGEWGLPIKLTFRVHAKTRLYKQLHR